MSNALDKKFAFLRWRTDSSSLTRARSLVTYVELASGGAKRSPSERRSDKLGWKISFSRILSSALKTLLSLSRLAQNESPTATHSSTDCNSPLQLPCVSGETCFASDRSKLSSLRSTPWSL